MRWRNSDASNKKYRRNRCEISSDLKALRFSVCWISRWTSVEWRWPSGMTVISFLVLGVELKVEYIDAGGGRVTGCCWNFISFGQEINRFSAATLWQAHLPLSSLVAQRSKRLPAMQETSVRSQGWEDPLRRKWQPTPVFLPGESHGQRSLVGCSPRGYKQSTRLSDFTHLLTYLNRGPLYLVCMKPLDIVLLFYWEWSNFPDANSKLISLFKKIHSHILNVVLTVL